MKRVFLLLVLLTSPAFAQDPPQIPYPDPAAYLEQLVQKAEHSLSAEVPDKSAWLANRDRYRSELKEMLGLEPEPPRGELHPVVTGTLAGEGFVVEKLHFQSLPGLYVTANFFRPETVAEKLPVILYLSGHGPTYAPDGTSCGNKASYHHHGVWFAQHGYCCLILDTVQWGEILGEHHGTYRLNRWGWTSRGYTPAGVETWAGIRALDYLATRPEADMEKVGVTGRSGGGAYTWYLTAVDERVKVAAPTAGITTLRDHVIGGCIEGHCDCMYMVNTYGWDFDKLAALSAPRPLLISNTDKDDIFPLEGVLQIHRSTRRIYEMLGAEKNLGLQISEGPHKDTQPLNMGAFHWFERFLKGRDLMDVIREPAVKIFEPEQLRVFTEIPKDEINTRIDELFVPLANPPVPQTREEWETMRDGWMKVLRQRGMPAQDGEDADALLLPPAGPHAARRFFLAGVSPAGKRQGIGMLHWMLLNPQPDRSGIALHCPTTSYLQGPYFPGILKYMDIPQAVAMAAEKTKVRITGRREDWTWAIQTAEKMGFAQNLEILPAIEIVDQKKVWDAAPHNAFTSLTRYRDEWFLTFREGSSHVPGTDGAVRVLVSKDGDAWESAALLTETGIDLRDPKFCLAPDGRLMLTIGGSVYDGTAAAGARRTRTGARTRTAFSTDGRTWTAPLPACEDGQWLWRATPFRDKLYGAAYTVAPENKFKLSLWQSGDGLQFTRLTRLDPGRNVLPNETTLRFSDSGTLYALTRDENSGKRGHARFGVSEPPYKSWSWTDTGHVIQGPDFLRLTDGRMLYAGRDFANGQANTTIGFLTATGQALPQLTLPSGGDCSYPGLAEGPDGQIWISYYSSHEGKTAIYLARLKLAGE